MPNLIGTGNNQVPTNGMLGGLAYQSPDNVVIKNLELTNLSGHNSVIPSTAVDVFVYDTRKDSDGGAWRKRTQHTSWYNETLNTATRGARREFPAVAVIVLEYNGVMAIYDGDDPDMPMWIKFVGTGVSSWNQGVLPTFNGYTAINALNGIIAVATTNQSFGFIKINFISDNTYNHTNSGNYGGQDILPLSQRNSSGHTFFSGSGSLPSSSLIFNNNINDVAMTVLPNAPIDPSTGLPVPTIAVATAGGVSVIRDDGTVYDITSDTIIHHEPRSISFLKSRLLWTEGNNYDLQDRVFLNAPIPNSDIQLPHNGSLPSEYIGYGIGGGATNIYSNLALNTVLNNEVSPRERKFQISDLNDNIYLGSKHFINGGIEIINQNINSPSNGMISVATTSYNTGWMHGDIKGAFLSDTDATNISSSNFVTNGDFSSGTSNWNVPFGVGDTNSFTTNGSGQAVWTVTAGSYWLDQQVYLTPGKTYSISAELISSTNNIWIRIGSGPGGTSEIFDKMTWVSNTEYQFTVPSTWTNNIYLQFGIQATGTLTFDNVVLKEREPDYSVNNNGLQVFGTITKTPVATGADLVAYSGWSYSNYMDNTSYAVNFGNPVTISIVFWQKITDIANYSYGVSFSHGNTVKGGISNGASSSSYPGQGYFNMGSQTLYTGSRVDDGNWHCLVGTISGTAKKFYLDGREVESATINNYDMSGISRIHVGSYGINHDYAHLGSLALLRVSKSAPSAAQVKKMYEDEKVLFQENAACTLYGSSDAVTALAYDDDNQLLHVGTSSGRSDFQGLRRINNTTTAVTTAISASNGLIAEQ